MRSDKVRSTFLDFFATRGHEPVHSSSLVPAGDATLLFTNAGMVQFKDVFTGADTRANKRATTSQKCVRAGGKHNDLDEVGKTTRHHTFFEMLGNFSFGDYFKPDAISWAWELLTEVYGIDRDRLIVTVFGGDDGLGVGADDEARDLWHGATGFGAERIVSLGTKENFWMMGETGPMGPCSEIHCYMGDDPSPRLPTTDDPESAWDDWLEIWNLVFMQYERKVAGGPLAPLPAPSIDTGAGLERVTSVLQGVKSNYDTDLFKPLLATAAKLASKKYGDNESDDISMRVIADHARASAFLIADGVFPEKTTREYTLRRIFRRAVRHGKLLGIEEPFLHHVCDAVVDNMSGAFPELAERRSVIREVALDEEKRFRATLDRGLGRLEDEFERRSKQASKVLPGAVVFQLHDTFGFPWDLTEIVAEEHGFSIDKRGFDAELDTAKARSKFDSGGGSTAAADLHKELASSAPASEFLGSFLGYETTRASAKIIALAAGSSLEKSAAAGDTVAFVANRTPFYGESGGQCGDTGIATSAASAEGATIRITNAIKPTGSAIVHLGTLENGSVSVGDELELVVDENRRNRIRANHSATHLLHLALKQVLGPHVAQKGSLVAPDRLRFDFSHSSPMSTEERNGVEDRVNTEVLRNAASTIEVLAFDEAKKRGAVAMFGEKYGETVRVVQIGGESLEFCGGTHVGRAGDIGLFKLVSEAGVAQGVRRIEAVTGVGALAYVRKLEDRLGELGARLKVSPADVGVRVEKMQTDLKALERNVTSLKSKLASGGARDLLSEVALEGGVKLLVTQTEVADTRALRETGDNLRDRIGSGIIVLAGVADGKVSLLAMVTKDLTDRFHAGKLLKGVAEVLGGRGGGRPDMAQGGGSDPDKVPAALARAVELVRQAAGE